MCAANSKGISERSAIAVLLPFVLRETRSTPDNALLCELFEPGINHLQAGYFFMSKMPKKRDTRN